MDREKALKRLSRFARGERMQDVWASKYVPDSIREDLKLVLDIQEEDVDPQGT